jgi:hypothetical protein
LLPLQKPVCVSAFFLFQLLNRQFRSLAAAMNREGHSDSLW